MKLEFRNDIGPLGTFRFELDVAAQRMLTQIQSNNKQLEELIQKASIEAIDELSQENGGLAEYVKTEVKKQLLSAIRDAMLPYNVREQVVTLVNNKVFDVVNSRIESVIEKLLKDIFNEQPDQV